MAIVIALDFSVSDIDRILRSYGYCLSESLAADAVIKWYVNNSRHKSGARLLNEINDTLESMGLPLLMTRVR